MEAAPHGHSLVGLGWALNFSWTVYSSVGQRAQTRGKAPYGDVKLTSRTRCQWSLSLLPSARCFPLVGWGWWTW